MERVFGGLVVRSARWGVKVSEVRGDLEGRSIACLVKWGALRNSLCCIYAPTNILDLRVSLSGLDSFIIPNTVAIVGEILIV